MVLLGWDLPLPQPFVVIKQAKQVSSAGLQRISLSHESWSHLLTPFQALWPVACRCCCPSSNLFSSVRSYSNRLVVYFFILDPILTLNSIALATSLVILWYMFCINLPPKAWVLNSSIIIKTVSWVNFDVSIPCEAAKPILSRRWRWWKNEIAYWSIEIFICLFFLIFNRHGKYWLCHQKTHMVK